jgi:hypothetical protein
MCDQFLQALLILGRTLSDQQNEQFGIIRAELEELRGIAREIKKLQARAAKQQPPAVRPPGTPPEAAASRNGRRPGEAPHRRNGEAGSGPVPPAAAANGNGDGGRPAAGPVDEDLHAEISLRLEALQQERQGRWRSLLQLLAGNRADG